MNGTRRACGGPTIQPQCYRPSCSLAPPKSSCLFQLNYPRAWFWGPGEGWEFLDRGTNSMNLQWARAFFVSLRGKYRPREYWRFDTLPFLSVFLRSRALTCPLLVSVYLPLASLQTWDLQPTPVWEWELSKGPKPKQLNEDYHGSFIIGLVATCLHNIHSLFLVTELRFCLGGNVTNRIICFLELYCKNTTTW